jgi:cell division septum initiation protein DivIVA
MTDELLVAGQGAKLLAENTDLTARLADAADRVASLAHERDQYREAARKYRRCLQMIQTVLDGCPTR